MLDRSHRFHGLGSLNFAYKQGQTVRGQNVSLKFVRNSRRNSFRAAVVVGRKVSKSAVVRNRIRRRIYEALQAEAHGIREPYDLLFTVFSDQAAATDFADLQRQIRALLTKANVLMAPGPAHDIVSTEGKQG